MNALETGLLIIGAVCGAGKLLDLWLRGPQRERLVRNVESLWIQYVDSDPIAAVRVPLRIAHVVFDAIMPSGRIVPIKIIQVFVLHLVILSVSFVAVGVSSGHSLTRALDGVVHVDSRLDEMIALSREAQTKEVPGRPPSESGIPSSGVSSDVTAELESYREYVRKFKFAIGAFVVVGSLLLYFGVAQLSTLLARYLCRAAAHETNAAVLVLLSLYNVAIATVSAILVATLTICVLNPAYWR